VSDPPWKIEVNRDVRSITVVPSDLDSATLYSPEMNEHQISHGAMRDKIQEAISWTRMEQYEEAIDVFEKYLSILSSEGDLQDKRFAASAFSYYGLCVAMVRHKYAEAVKYCNISVKANFMEPEHRINLALVFLERDDRKNAVKNLEAGLRLQPSNKRIHRIFKDIGRRKPVMFSFLSRRNPLNVWIGRLREPKTDS
jgi:tetratricopeptide (TPR) repeat protein